MHNFSLMCDSLSEAEHSRQRIEQGLTNSFYDEQTELVKHSPLGQPLSKSIVEGELAQVKLHHIFMGEHYSWVNLYKSEGGRLYGQDGRVHIIRPNV